MKKAFTLLMALMVVSTLLISITIIATGGDSTTKEINPTEESSYTLPTEWEAIGPREEPQETTVETESIETDPFDVDHFYFMFMGQECLFPATVDDFFVHAAMWELTQDDLSYYILPDRERDLRTTLGDSDLTCTVAHHNDDNLPFKDSTVVIADCNLINGGDIDLFGYTITSNTFYDEVKGYYGEPDIDEVLQEVSMLGYRTQNVLIEFLFNESGKCTYVTFNDETFY